MRRRALAGSDAPGRRRSADTSWRFPLPAADLALAPADLLQALNRENDGRALLQLESHLVRELRMWRPDVVITHHGKVAGVEIAAATESPSE